MVSSESRSVAVPKYFSRPAREPKYRNVGLFIILTIGGLISIPLGFFLWILPYFAERSSFGFICIGFVIFISGIGAFLIGVFPWFIRSRSNRAQRKKYSEELRILEPKPSDEQIDAWHHGDLERIKHDALNKLDLLPQQIMGDPDDPIMIVGPNTEALGKRGLDGIIRFSIHDVVVVFLTEYHLAAYSSTIDLSDGLPTMESTQEYHYVDVVSVSTMTDNSRIFRFLVGEEKKPVKTSMKFALSVASGERIEVAIAFPFIDEVIKDGKLAPTGAENAVKIIRARLREKKGET